METPETKAPKKSAAKKEEQTPPVAPEAPKPPKAETPETKAMPVRRKGFIYASKGKLKTTFSQVEWNLLGKNKSGWVEDVATPPEVKKLNGE